MPANNSEFHMARLYLYEDATVYLLVTWHSVVAPEDAGLPPVYARTEEPNLLMHVGTRSAAVGHMHF